MAHTDIQIDDLISKLKKLENQSLMQRVSDFLDGILAASDNQTDWWDELPETVKRDHEQGEKDGEEGNVILLDDFLKKHRK